MIPPDKPIWEWSKKEFNEYRRQLQLDYDDNVCLRELLIELKAKKPDLHRVFKLAKEFVEGFEVEDIDEPPRKQPRNREEAIAENKRCARNSVLRKKIAVAS